MVRSKIRIPTYIRTISTYRIRTTYLSVIENFIARQVEDLVSNDKLNVVSEEQVFVAVMDWIKHNIAERSQYIAQVRLIHIRF